MRIGLWGAPGSGKTTFLASLFVAVVRSSRDINIFGNDHESTEFLIENTSRLADVREFPRPTQAERFLSWTIVTKVEALSRARFRTRQAESIDLKLSLDMLDAPGARFGLATDPAEDDLTDQLAGCQGILYLFDPATERITGDAYEYFHRTIFALAERRSRHEIGKLPHHLAVCITKFDDPFVYGMAKRSGYVSYSEDFSMAPRISDEFAPKFFADLCRQSTSGDADLVDKSINRYFLPERVKYFVTSAIGFHAAGRGGRFREGDIQNTIPSGDGREVKIRGPIRPINVIEPILWLAQSIPTHSR
jgi:hypothetical protein